MTLLEHAVDLVRTKALQGNMSLEEMKAAIVDVHSTLKGLSEAEATAQMGEMEPAQPPVNPKKSITKNKITCLECGQSFKMLSAKHLASHGLTPKEYRKKWGMRASQPLCAKALSETRAKFATENNLADKLIAGRKARA